MGIYDREYYRDETRGSGWWTGLAPACRWIITLNVATLLLQEISPTLKDFFQEWCYAYPEKILAEGQIFRLITATFLHADLFHLLWNLLFLWFFGREIEAMYGTREFTLMYLTAGAFSTLCWALISVMSHGFGPSGPMLGASGAVMAVAVLNTLYHPRREILLFFVLPMPMWLVLAIYLGSDLLSLLQEFRGAGRVAGVAFAAHLGGALFGYAYKSFDLRWARLWSLLPRRRRPRFRVIAAEPRDHDRPSSFATGPGRSATGTSTQSSATLTVTEDQLDARLDEILAKIARDGRASLTEEENQILQEASRRARRRRSDRL
jgi:membrane associated rhomboid family serine protease